MIVNGYILSKIEYKQIEDFQNSLLINLEVRGIPYNSSYIIPTEVFDNILMDQSWERFHGILKQILSGKNIISCEI